jgi:hypothetical protein
MIHFIVLVIQQATHIDVSQSPGCAREMILFAIFVLLSSEKKVATREKFIFLYISVATGMG